MKCAYDGREMSGTQVAFWHKGKQYVVSGLLAKERLIKKLEGGKK